MTPWVGLDWIIKPSKTIHVFLRMTDLLDWMVEVAALGSDDALMASARTDDRLGSHDLTTGSALLESGREKSSSSGGYFTLLLRKHKCL